MAFLTFGAVCAYADDEPQATKRLCATEAPSGLERARVVSTLSYFRQANAKFAGLKGSIEVPVAFHVLQNGDAGNLTDAVLEAQIDALNLAFKPYNIRFRRVSASHTDNASYFTMGYKSAVERAAKKNLGKDPEQQLNFYTADLAGELLGWATFPSDLAGDPERDGVVVHYQSLPGGAKAHFDQGKTAVHEVAHWLGLFHTFEGGCVVPGDEVDDTPFEGKDASGCPDPQPDTCPAPGMDPIHNYMDYSYDACMTEFTPGQGARMREQVATFRPALLSSSLKSAVKPFEIK